MKEIRTSVEIDAPPERVWAVLVDTERWGEWNPFADRVVGELAVGERIEVHLLAGPGGRASTIRPDVTAVAPGRELRWVGGLLQPVVLRGEHSFVLEPVAEARTRLLHGESFTGVLPVLLGPLLLRMAPSYQAMNDALKARVEQRGGANG